MIFFKAIPADAPIRILGTLPPTSTKAARHAGLLAHLLHRAGHQVHTTSAAGPAYAGQFLHFAPKRRFEPMLATQLKDRSEVAILYPAGLGVERINQKRWLHRRIEEARRIKLVAGLLFNKRRAVLVFQPSQLWHFETSVPVLLALLAKLIRPGRVKITRQRNGANALAKALLGHQQPEVDIAEIEETAFRLATDKGQNLGMFMSLAWFRRAIIRLPDDDPQLPELRVLFDAADLFTHAAPPPFRKPFTGRISADLPDPIISNDQNVPISAYMLHLHQSHHLAGKFPLNRKSGRHAFIDWYVTRAPKLANHCLPMPPEVISAYQQQLCRAYGLDSVASAIPSAGCDVALPPYLLALHRKDPRNTTHFPIDTAAGRIAFAFRVIIDHASFQLSPDFAGAALQDFFAAPAGGNPKNITRIELLGAILAHAPVTSRAMLETPWKATEIRRWMQNIAALGYPLLSKMHPTPPASAPEIHFTGRSQSQTGLGQNLMMNQNALQGLSPNRDVYLHHVNANMIPEQMLRHNSKGAFHIGFLLWELEELPPSHYLADKLLDEIWVPSRYVQQIYQSAFKQPVTFVGKGFDLPHVKKTNLGRYGVVANATCFLVCFDQHSSVARKNPLAAVQAFLAAFPNDPGKAMLVKTTPAPADHWGDPEGQMKRIRKLAAQDQRIVVIEENLPFKELLSLIRSVDCLVSAHRAEGFGYLLAYAQKLETPVIATNYSGSTDFCTPKTALVVDYHLRKVKKGETIVQVPGAKWAEIDQPSLADAMKTLLCTPKATAARVKAGKQLMDDFYSPGTHRARVRARLNALGLTKCSLNVPVADDSETRTVDRPRRLPPSG